MKTQARIATISLATLLCLLLTVAPASAQSCQSTLSNLNSWFLDKPNGSGNYKVAATVTGVTNGGLNAQSNAVTSFAEGGYSNTAYLSYHPEEIICTIYKGCSYYPAVIEDTKADGPLAQFFSDRLWGGGGGFGGDPFSPYQTDKLGVRIALEAGTGVNAGFTTLTLYSWGNSQFSMQASCQNGILYGPVGTNGMVMITLREVYSASPQ